MPKLTVSQRESEEPDVNAKGMEFLTGGLTSEGDTFLIGAAAVLLMGLLYPIVDAWSLLAFVFVPIAAVLVRVAVRRRTRDRDKGFDQSTKT